MSQDSIYTGILFPRETLNRLDKHKGYYSRNKFLLKIAEEYLAKLENVNENGVRGREYQSRPTTTNSSTLDQPATIAGGPASG